MARNVRDVIMFSGFDPALSELSAAGTFRMLARAVDGVPMLSVNGGPYTPIAGAPGGNDFSLLPNVLDAFLIHEGANDYFAIDTSTGAETMHFGESGVLGLIYDFELKDNVANVWRVHQGANDYFKASTTNAGENITIGNLTAPPVNTILGANLGVGVGDNQANAFYVIEGGTFYYNIASTNGAELHTWNGAGPGAQYGFELADNRNPVFNVKEGARTYITISTNNGAEQLTFAGLAPATCQIVFGGITPMVMGSRALTQGQIAADPGGVAASGSTYWKDVAGVTHLFAQRSDGSVVDLTP